MCDPSEWTDKYPPTEGTKKQRVLYKCGTCGEPVIEMSKGYIKDGPRWVHAELSDTGWPVETYVFCKLKRAYPIDENGNEAK